MNSAQSPMLRALELATKGVGFVSPNPPVGAVAIRDGVVIAEGYHTHFGGPHAEAALIASVALDSLRGADLYVTLEPCAHFGKTPPCTDAIIEAGFKRVFYAVADPNPVTHGQGPARMGAAGITVERGLMSEEGARLIAGYLSVMRRGRPLVTAKWAMTADGRIATVSGSSQWISGKQSLLRSRRERSQFDAILIGRGTLQADDPLLLAREDHVAQPIRIVFDSRLSIAKSSQLLNSLQRAPLWLVCDEDQELAARRAELESQGVLVLAQPRSTSIPGLDLERALKSFASHGVTQLLVEGGSEVHGSFFDQGWVDRVQITIAPKLIGGAGAPGPIGGAGVAIMKNAHKLTNCHVEEIGGDIRLSGDLSAAAAGNSA